MSGELCLEACNAGLQIAEGLGILAALGWSLYQHYQHKATNEALARMQPKT